MHRSVFDYKVEDGLKSQNVVRMEVVNSDLESDSSEEGDEIEMVLFGRKN